MIGRFIQAYKSVSKEDHLQKLIAEKREVLEQRRALKEREIALQHEIEVFCRQNNLTVP